jgi:MoxR-like ATPase
MIAGGHLLIEDVPGVGKTTLAVALANSIAGDHHRIQFTSDLLPSDVIGVPIFNQQENRFEFKQGPLFANIVLADEINRTTPKTQSCMLEAMQDGKVSIDRQVYQLPKPFMVIATQNPIEHHGTYPLPESQLDRFMMRIKIGYPNRDYEMKILSTPENERHQTTIHAVGTLERMIAIQRLVEEVWMEPALLQYMLNIIEATRKDPNIELGVSTRGTLMLKRSCQAWALMHGRAYCTPDDVKKLALPVLSHRILVRSTFRSTQPQSEATSTAALLLERILGTVEVPV